MKDLDLSKEELEACKKRIVEAVQRFVEDTGVKGAVVALSGGVDSALVAALANMALVDKLSALIMPEVGVTKEEDIEHAITLAKERGIPYRIIELNEVLDAVRRAYPELLDISRGVLARANLAPRGRMLFNYAVSNMEDLIVL
ncbi:MAG: NAD(+) synthase, partial [Candidatus Hydrothermarchaeales archaeon]